MIDAEVKTMDYVDPLPPANAAAALNITFGIGERGSEARDNFDLLVCTPSWLAEQIEKRGGMWPRGVLVVESIDAEYVRRTVQLLADQFRQSRDWVQFTERLNRYLRWEFEDYNDWQGEPLLPERRS